MRTKRQVKSSILERKRWQARRHISLLTCMFGTINQKSFQRAAPDCLETLGRAVIPPKKSLRAFFKTRENVFSRCFEFGANLLYIVGHVHGIDRRTWSTEFIHLGGERCRSCADINNRFVRTQIIEGKKSTVLIKRTALGDDSVNMHAGRTSSGRRPHYPPILIDGRSGHGTSVRSHLSMSGMRGPSST